LHIVIRFAAVVVLVLSLGLHWAFLQSVAWAGMLVSYSQGATFKEAVSKTFDGQHPCKLCTAIEQGRKEEKRQDQEQPAKPGLKMDPGLTWQAAAFTLPRFHDHFATPDLAAVSRHEEPPKPRPRHCGPDLLT
jgi:hypothetical protein